MNDDDDDDDDDDDEDDDDGCLSDSPAEVTLGHQRT